MNSLVSNENRIQNLDIKPAQKCVGFSRKIGNTRYEVSGFYSDSATETLEHKIKRTIREESLKK